ncbi:MAG: hypothetical protein AB1489_25745 [Acidobacteriota bacterium]
MSYQCHNCGQAVASEQAICSYCGVRAGRVSAAPRTNLLLIGIIFFAIVGVGILAAMAYFALTSTEIEPPTTTSTPNSTPTTPSSSVPISTPTNSNSASSPVSVPPVSSNTIDKETINRYSEAIQPLLADLSGGMSNVILDLREFLKTVNNTRNTRDTRRVIDNFRDQLKGHRQQIATLNDALKKIASPTELTRQHQQLINGVDKYVAALDGYTRGLSAYNFSQIRTSQNELEAADREIKQAAEEFQQFLANLNVTSQ